MRLDGDCPTYCCSLLVPRQDGGDVACLSVHCQFPQPSLLTGWHVHSCLLPPAAMYSKTHTSLWMYCFNLCHFISQFHITFGLIGRARTWWWFTVVVISTGKMSYGHIKISVAELHGVCFVPVCGHRAMLSCRISVVRSSKISAVA